MPKGVPPQGVYLPGGTCLWFRGVYLLGVPASGLGVYLLGGYLPGAGTCLWSRGVYLPGGVPASGLGGVPARGVPASGSGGTCPGTQSTCQQND